MILVLAVLLQFAVPAETPQQAALYVQLSQRLAQLAPLVDASEPGDPIQKNYNVTSRRHSAVEKELTKNVRLENGDWTVIYDLADGPWAFHVRLDTSIVAPKSFSDNFDRAELGSTWRVDAGSFSVSSNQLLQNTGVKYSDSRTTYIESLLETPNQYGKIHVLSVGSSSWGFIFRNKLVDGDHYEVTTVAGSNSWRWARYNPGFVSIIQEVSSGPAITNNNWIGVVIEGTGDNTAVKIWNWGSIDPDAGGMVDIANNWGAPVTTMTNNPTAEQVVDAGQYVGIRDYTGSATSSQTADNWFAGDTGLDLPEIEGSALLLRTWKAKSLYKTNFGE